MIFDRSEKQPAAARCTNAYFTGEQSPAMVALLKKPWTFSVQISQPHGHVTVLFTLFEQHRLEHYSGIQATLAVSQGTDGGLHVWWEVESHRDGSDFHAHQGHAETVDSAYAAVVDLVARLRMLPCPSGEEANRLRALRGKTVHDEAEADALARIAEYHDEELRQMVRDSFARKWGHAPGEKPAAEAA